MICRRFAVLSAVFALSCSSGDGAVPADGGTTGAREDRAATLAIDFVARDGRGTERHRIVAEPVARGFDRAGDDLIPIIANVTARVRLPSRADRAFVVESHGIGISVTIVGAKDVAAAPAGGMLVYPGAVAGATLFQIPTRGGTEEYLRFAERPEERATRYDVALPADVGVRVVDSVFEILQPSGNPVLRTTAPWIVDANGVTRRGALRVEGCAFDTNGAAPWGRPVTKPGASRCRVITTWDDDGLTYPVLVDPPWTNTAGLATKRYDHGASWIAGCTEGCVLVTGGRANTTVLSSTELFDTKTRTFAAADPIPTGVRFLHAQTSVGGRAFIAGGATSVSSGEPTGALASTYLYDPNTTPKWRVMNSLPGGARWGAGIGAHDKSIIAIPGWAAVVGVAGGFNGTSASTAFDMINDASAATPSWVAVTAMAEARVYPAMAFARVGGCTLPSCPSPFAIVAGGEGSTGTKSATVVYYNVSSWASGGSLSVARSQLAGAIANGKFVIGGGLSSSGAVTNVDAFDLVAKTTAKIGDLNSGRRRLAASELNNQVLFSGGLYFQGGATQFNLTYGGKDTNLVAADGTSSTTAMTYARARHTSTGFGWAVAAIGGVLESGPLVQGTTLTYPAVEEIWEMKQNGGTCTTSLECIGGNCVDGYCCNSTCANTCEACNVAGALGTCTTIGPTAAPASYPAGKPVTGFGTTRTVCTDFGTTCGFRCDGTSNTTCKAVPSSTQCVTPTCTGGIETQAAFCSGGGACNTASTKPCGRYACGATACKTTCTVLADCSTGNKCDMTLNQCIPSGGQGSGCAVDGECTAGLKCVDGACCTATSCSAPLSCNVPGAAGTCKLPLGEACTAATAAQCGSGKCVDGVCCNTDCTEQCGACNRATKMGTCSPVLGAPVGTRTACVGSGTCGAKCDGSNPLKCADPPNTDTVCGAASCDPVTTIETETAYCNGLGACATPTSTACRGFKCGGTACKKTCGGDVDCATNYFCAAGECVTTGIIGTACTGGGQCSSGNCVDGVCCSVASCTAPLTCSAGKGSCAKPNGVDCSAASECGSGVCKDAVCCDKACDGQCEACDVAGSKGQCVAVSGAPHAARTACTGTGACQAACDGSNRTACAAAPGTSTVCGTPSCTSGISKAAAFCNGAGTCGAAASKGCSPYGCDATDCKTVCAADTDCATGYTCKANACVPKGGVACAKSDDCVSGFCIDGVCCDTACGGQCEACDVSGAEGKCSPVVGAAHGKRAACFDGGGDACKSLACDGSDRAKCAAFPGFEKTCGATTCTNGVLNEAPRCDGTGACKAATTTKSCGGYACDTAACKTACAATTDCIAGYVCDAAKCRPATATCSDDRATSISADKTKTVPCAPYLCNVATGECLTTCSSTEQCASGALCDGGNCVPSAPVTEDGGGCSTKKGGHSSSSSATMLGAAAIAVALYRFRALRRRDRVSGTRS